MKLKKYLKQSIIITQKKYRNINNGLKTDEYQNRKDVLELFKKYHFTIKNNLKNNPTLLHTGYFSREKEKQKNKEETEYSTIFNFSIFYIFFC